MASEKDRGAGHAPVRLWRVDLDVGAGAEADLRRELSPSEIARAERFARPQDRRRFVVARGTLRALLGSLLDERPRAVPLEAGASGKPRVAGSEHGLHFNVSHSGSLALICVADCGEVGVDLEMVRPVSSAVSIARRYFAPAEASFIEGSGPAEDDEPAGVDRRFLLCWTRKEALAKAVGAGLSLDLRGLAVPLDPPGGIARLGGPDRGPAERWLLLDVPIDSEHVAAVALPASAVDGSASPAAGPAHARLGAPLDHCSEIDVLS
jgi:4'-phosphopantetheinyl transferase